MLEERTIAELSARQRFSDLLDLSFSLPHGKHYLDDFPIWDPRFNNISVHRIGVFRGENLVSCAGVRLAQLKTPEHGPVSVAMIGAVATHPDSRGSGMASKNVSYLLEWAKEKGAAAAVLWSSEHQFYERLGFKFCGEQIRLPLSDILASRSLEEGLYEEIHTGWTPAIFEYLQKRPEGLVLAKGDRHWYEAHKNVKWFYTGTQNEPRAYAAFERGIDLPGIIHEWGGETRQLFRIFEFIQKTEPNAAVLGSDDLFRRHGIFPDAPFLEPLCLMSDLTQPSAMPRSIWIWGLDAV